MERTILTHVVYPVKCICRYCTVLEEVVLYDVHVVLYSYTVYQDEEYVCV